MKPRLCVLPDKIGALRAKKEEKITDASIVARAVQMCWKVRLKKIASFIISSSKC